MKWSDGLGECWPYRLQISIGRRNLQRNQRECYWSSNQANRSCALSYQLNKVCCCSATSPNHRRLKGSLIKGSHLEPNTTDSNTQCCGLIKFCPRLLKSWFHIRVVTTREALPGHLLLTQEFSKPVLKCISFRSLIRLLCISSYWDIQSFISYSI